ncbi:MAG: NUDIX pyrophosphatase [Candidatus Woesearchaeota archaeon]
MSKDTKVNCILFRKKNNEYEFLLLKRIGSGSWQPITGSVESTDASIKDAAYREMLEETGIGKRGVIRVIENVHVFTWLDKGNPITEHVFCFEVTPDAKVRLDVNVCKEHDDFQWVSFDDALKRLEWDTQEDAFRKLKALLE